MVDQERIAQAERNIKQYLRDGRLREATYHNIAYRAYMQNYQESILLAKQLHKQGSVLWTIVSSYYAMFYTVNAALLKAGYRIGGHEVHKVATDALIALLRDSIDATLLDSFEQSGATALQLIEHYELERKNRSAIQYETTAAMKREQAIRSYKHAQEFCYVLEALAEKF